MTPMGRFPQVIAKAQMEAANRKIEEVLDLLADLEGAIGECRPNTFGPMSPADFDRVKKSVAQSKGHLMTAYTITRP